jgi:hypothetical protein
MVNFQGVCIVNKAYSRSDQGYIPLARLVLTVGRRGSFYYEYSIYHYIISLIMPKYYCDYCKIFLTHDSPRARRDHNSGWRHALNVKNYYMGRITELQETLEPILQAYAIQGQAIPPPPGTSIMRPSQNVSVQRVDSLLASLPAPPPPPPFIMLPNQHISNSK